MRHLLLLLILVLPSLAQFPPVRWAGGTAAPASTACDASGEIGSIYVQSGDPATIVNQAWQCRQIGASTYAWHPIDHFVGTTLPTTCTSGQMAVDSDATSGQRVYVCETSTWVLQGDGGGAGSAWSALTAPSAATTFVSNGTSETADFDFQANYTTGALFNIRTTTGTPSGSTLLNVQSHDADVLVLRASGDGTGGITVTQTGILTTTTNDTAKAAIVVKDAAGVDTLKIYASNSVAPDTTIPSIRASNDLKVLLLDPGATGEIRMFNTTAGNLILGEATRMHFGARSALRSPVDGTLEVVINAATAYSDINAAPGGTVQACAQSIITTAELNDADTEEDEALFTLAAQGTINRVWLKTSTVFAGGGVATLVVSIGTTGSPLGYSIQSYNLLTTVADAHFLDSRMPVPISSASHAVIARFTSTGANLSALTSGSVTIGYCYDAIT